MTGPGEPTRPEDEESDPRSPESQRPQPQRPGPTGWPGRPDAPRYGGGTTPGSVMPGSAGGQRPESFRVNLPGSAPSADRPQPERPAPQATGWTTAAPARHEAPRPQTPQTPPSSQAPGPTQQTPAPQAPQAPRPQQPAQPSQSQPPTTQQPRAAAPSGPAVGGDPAGERPAPVRPPVPTGVPPRPTPLPPPRATGSTAAAADLAGSLASSTTTGSTTVVPETPRRSATRPQVARPSSTARTRKAKLAVKRFDPWSVFVTSLSLSLLLGVITVIAAFVLYLVLDALGVPKSLNDNLGDITKSTILTQGRFMGVAALIAAANVLLLTALATIGAMLYNVVATFTGGLELTLGERD